MALNAAIAFIRGTAAGYRSRGGRLRLGFLEVDTPPQRGTPERMDRLDPATAGLLADAILVLHVAVVAFVVGGLLLILLGGALRWRWVRRPGFRWTHLALVGFIVAQTWLGELCPLTTWEQDLRGAAGQVTHDQGFIEFWLGRLIFLEAPWWAFVAAYTLFGALVAASWWWVRPERGKRASA